jgi:hypothetical protein
MTRDGETNSCPEIMSSHPKPDPRFLLLLAQLCTTFCQEKTKLFPTYRDVQDIKIRSWNLGAK